MALFSQGKISDFGELVSGVMVVGGSRGCRARRRIVGSRVQSARVRRSRCQTDHTFNQILKHLVRDVLVVPVFGTVVLPVEASVVGGVVSALFSLLHTR